MRRTTAVLCVAITLLGAGEALASEREALVESVGSRILRARQVKVSPETITSRLMIGDRIPLRLFPGTEYEGVLDHVATSSSGALIWQGHLRGVANSEVFLLVDGKLIAGSITLPGGSYEIRYSGGGLHEIREMDESRSQGLDNDVIPPDLGPVGASRGEALQLALPAAGNEITRLDLMVIYTKRANREAGGRRAMRAMIELHVARANAALANSGARARFYLVKAKKVPYSEDESMSRDLLRLSGPNDGFLDQVPGMRRKYGADFVSLYRYYPGDHFCGRGFIGWSPWLLERDIDPASRAFNVVQSTCSGWVLGHELGHNLGLLHNREDYDDPELSATAAAFQYSFGLKKQSGPNPFLTLMAVKCTTGCTRLSQFSSPRKRYKGQRTGVKHSKPDAADAARSINKIRDLLAAHLECKVDCE